MSRTGIKIPGGEVLDFSKAFTSLMLFQSGPQSHNYRSAKFKLDCNMAALFPYLNGEIKGAQYFNKPEYIKFIHDKRLCIFYPTEGAFTPVEDHGDASSYLWKIVELFSDISKRSDGITPDYRPYRPISPLDVFKLLPGNNCKDCGYDTCLAFAAALSKQHVSHYNCPHIPTPIEENSTFQVAGKQGQPVQTISLALDSSDLLREVSKKESHIKKLEARLAEFEQSRTNNIEVNNAKLISPLTIREIEVLEMVACGSTNKEIAKEMHISEHTVKSHIIHIFDKLGVNDRAQASVWAAKSGLL